MTNLPSSPLVRLLASLLQVPNVECGIRSSTLAIFYGRFVGSGSSHPYVVQEKLSVTTPVEFRRH